jgi:hypothetical protein
MVFAIDYSNLMKKIYFYFVTLLYLLTVNTNFCLAQISHRGDSIKKNIIKITPWEIYIGSYNVQYERYISNHNSFEFLANFKYNTKNIFLNSDNILPNFDFCAKGLSFLVDYKFCTIHWTKNVRTYYTYISPFLKYSWLNFIANGPEFIYENNINVFKIGVDWGFQRNLIKGIVLDIFLGPYVRYANGFFKKNDFYNLPWETNNLVLYTFKNSDIGLGLRAGINIGYCF